MRRDASSSSSSLMRSRETTKTHRRNATGDAWDDGRDRCKAIAIKSQLDKKDEKTDSMTGNWTLGMHGALQYTRQWEGDDDQR